MKFIAVFAVIAAISAASAASGGRADAPNEAFFDALRVADAKLATVADRLAVANVTLCDQRAPSLGLILHSLRQYREKDWPIVRRVFAFRVPVSVEAVIDGGVAKGAGVEPNDGVVAIGGVALPTTVAEAGQPVSSDRDRALGLIDAALASQPLAVTFDHNGERVRLELIPAAACRSRFELVVGKGLDAQADGLNVQIGAGFLEGFSDEELAVVVAHELAHNILRHRARLDAAGVSRGIAAEFGRNQRLIRLTEDQADALSVYLLANAGYDPYAAGRFWRAHGSKIGLEGIFRSRTHSSAKDRAKAMDDIAGPLASLKQRPIVPAMLADRDKPLD